MTWRSVRFNWNQARAFLVTAEEGSLSAAARALGMSQPTLGRQVDALEQELDVVLFERVGRGLILTPSGQELLMHVRAMGEAASRVSLAASGQSESIAGTIRISAGEAVSAFLLPPIVAKLREAAPNIQVEIVASNAPSDLKRREADIAIRNFRPRQRELVAKKIKDVAVRLYASPLYLRRLGVPRSPDDLTRAEIIGFDHTDALLKALERLGLKLTQDNVTVLSQSHLVGWEMVKQGVGIGVMQEDIGDAEPRVVRVLPDLEPIVIPVWLTAHRELNTSRRVRLVFDLLDEELGAP